MSNDQPDPDRALAEWRKRQGVYDSLSARLLPANKATLLHAIGEAGIDTVTVNYDGSDDESRIESVIAERDFGQVDLPAILVAMSEPDLQSGEVRTHQRALPQAVMDFAEDLVSGVYRHWQLGDGGYGAVVFDVDEGVVTIDHNARYVAVKSFEHKF